MQSRTIVLTAALALGLGACASGPSPAARAPDSPVATGDFAPGGTVVAVNGSKVDMASFYEGRRAIIVFYRGDW